MLNKILSQTFCDSRGEFRVIFDSNLLNENINCNQVIHVKSVKNVFRGMHFQKKPFLQRKILSVLEGEIIDFAINLDTDAENYLTLYVNRLSDKDNISLDIPNTYAHGYFVLSDACKLQYCIDNSFEADSNIAISFRSSQFDLSSYFDLDCALLSSRDEQALLLDDYLDLDF